MPGRVRRANTVSQWFLLPPGVKQHGAAMPSRRILWGHWAELAAGLPGGGVLQNSHITDTVPGGTLLSKQVCAAAAVCAWYALPDCGDEHAVAMPQGYYICVEEYTMHGVRNMPILSHAAVEV